MQDNLIYLCGPHGSGKTTLARELEKQNPRIMVPELFSRNIKFNTHPPYRQVLKICGRAIENYEYLDIAKKNPDKIVLGNRCIYDVFAYNQVYYKKGWISKETFDFYKKSSRDFFNDENEEPWAIFLNPGFETVYKHLEKRWKEKGKKWKEDDLEYTRFACQAYEYFKGNENIFYINHEISLESKEDIKKVNGWIKRIREKDLTFSLV